MSRGRDKGYQTEVSRIELYGKCGSEVCKGIFTNILRFGFFRRMCEWKTEKNETKHTKTMNKALQVESS